MSELVKKTAEITIKGIAKRVLALWAIPGEVVDILAEIVRRAITNPNDRSAQQMFQSIQAEIHLELAAKSAQFKDSRPPSLDDVEQGLIRFAQAHKTSGSHDKRRVLFNALHNSFRPEFYDEGFAQILWPKIEALEYPDLWFLNRVLLSLKPSDEAPVDFELLKVSEKKYVNIMNSDLEFEFARRLESHGLLVSENAISKVPGGARSLGGGGIVTDSNVVSLSPTGIAWKVRDFAFEEILKEDLASSTPSR